MFHYNDTADGIEVIKGQSYNWVIACYAASNIFLKAMYDKHLFVYSWYQLAIQNSRTISQKPIQESIAQNVCPSWTCSNLTGERLWS